MFRRTNTNKHKANDDIEYQHHQDLEPSPQASGGGDANGDDAVSNAVVTKKTMLKDAGDDAKGQEQFGFTILKKGETTTTSEKKGSNKEEGEPKEKEKKTNTFLSFVSKQYDVNNKGRLSTIGREMREMDTEGKGYLDNKQVHGIISKLHETQSHLLSAKRIITILGVALVLQALVMTGVIFLAVYLSKDFKPDSNGQLTNMNGDPLVMGGHSYAISIVPGDASERSEACIPIDKAASLVYDASSNIPVDIKLLNGLGGDVDEEEDQEDRMMTSFALGGSVQEFGNKICISKTGSDEAFICFHFDNNACDQSEQEGETVVTAGEDGNSRRMLRRRLFDESRKNYMMTPATLEQTIGSRNLNIVQSTNTLVLTSIEYGFVTAEPEPNQEDIMLKTGTAQYAVYYTIKKQINGNWYYWVMDTPNKKSSFNNNCGSQTAGYLSGSTILLKEESEVNIYSPEANWRFDEMQGVLVNRLNGRMVGIKDSETYLDFSSDPGYLEGIYLDLYEGVADDLDVLLLGITPLPVYDGEVDQYYLSTDEGLIYASDTEKKLTTRVRTTDTRDKCLYYYKSKEKHCNDWKCPTGNESCKAVWKITKSGKNGNCSNDLKGKPVCGTYTKNGQVPGYVDEPNDNYYDVWTIEKVDPTFWTPPDLERSNTFIAAVEANGWPNVALDAATTALDAVQFAGEELLDVILEQSATITQVFGGAALGIGFGVMTAILEFNAEDQIDKLYEELMKAIDELREEMVDADIRRSAIETVQLIGPKIYGSDESMQDEWFVESNLRTFKYATLINSRNDTSEINDKGMETLSNLKGLLDELDDHIDSLSCLDSNNILEDCSDGSLQFLYTVRFGWKLYKSIYFLYMSIFQEYYELLAYLLARDLFDNVGPGSATCPNGINSIDDIFTRDDNSTRSCYNAFSNVPNRDDFDRAIRNMDSARSALFDAFDTHFGNAWEQQCKHKDANSDCPLNWKYRYEFCEFDCAIGDIGFQRQACYRDTSSYDFELSSEYHGPCELTESKIFTDKDPYIDLKYDMYKGKSDKCNTNFRNPYYLNFVKRERRVSMETYYSMIFLRNETDVPKPEFDSTSSSEDDSELYSDYFELHSKFEELLRLRFDQILDDPRHYEALAMYNMCKDADDRGDEQYKDECLDFGYVY